MNEEDVKTVDRETEQAPELNAMQRANLALERAREYRRYLEAEGDIGLSLLILAVVANPKTAAKFSVRYARTLQALTKREQRACAQRIRYATLEHAAPVLRGQMYIGPVVESLKITIGKLGAEAERSACERIDLQTLRRWKRESSKRSVRWSVRPRQRRTR